MQTPRRIVLPHCIVDLERQEVLRDGTRVPLTHTEAGVLRWMAERVGRTVSRRELLLEVWGYREGVRSRTVDTTIQRIRSKIELEPSQHCYLKTIRGAGYCLDLPKAVDTAVDLVGREQEIRALKQSLSAGGPLCLALHGPGGVGKTTLARALAQQFAAETHQRVVWLDLAEDPSAIRVAARALAISATGRTWQEAADQVAHSLEDVAALVVCDGASTMEARRTLERWFNTTSLRLLVTTRESLGLEGAEEVELEPLGGGASTQLFECRCSRSLSQEEREQLPDLVSLLDGIPLAIELAATRAAMSTVDQICRALADHRHLAGGAKSGLGAGLREVFESLEPEDRLLHHAVSARYAAHLLNHGHVDQAERVARDFIDEHLGLAGQAGSAEFAGGLLGAILIEKGDLEEAFDLLLAA
ncbi:MAG: AAA family ATPase, partial [Proteobacteria bacterium]|nr:AAA family ATPase [Pseudomonadota bacterium]